MNANDLHRLVIDHIDPAMTDAEVSAVLTDLVAKLDRTRQWADVAVGRKELGLD